MEVFWREIGEFAVRVNCLSEDKERSVQRMFGARRPPDRIDPAGSFELTIRHGCEPNEKGLDTTVTQTPEGGWLFERPDYRLEISPDYRSADITYYDYIGLRCVLINWFSAVAARQNWGLVVHSSCVIHNGEAYLFAGYSGAGKSTVAALSRPRGLLSDEASLVKLTPDQPPLVYDSPMRSSLLQPAPVRCAPLKAIYFLRKSPFIRTHKLAGSQAFLYLFDKIWYWPHDPALTAETIRMSKRLVESVPTYGLEFQKNDLFWEAIS